MPKASYYSPSHQDLHPIISFKEISTSSHSLHPKDKMLFKPALLALLPFLFSSTQAVPASTPGAMTLSERQDGPSITLIFFSDTNCTDTVPPTIYTRQVYGDEACYIYPDQSYSSVLILEIDDQFIGTNTALQVGYTDTVANGDSCNWTDAIKFNIATDALVDQCQYIGIPTGQGKPDMPGNEYRLTSLEG